MNDGAMPQFPLKVNVAFVEFWQFVRRAYLAMGQFSEWQDFNYEIAVQDRGIARAFIHYRKRHFQRLAYVEGIGRSYQSNVSNDQLRAVLQTQLLPNDDELPTSKGGIESADYEESDSAEPERRGIPAFVIGVFLFLAGNFFVHYGAKRAENRRLILFGWHKYGLLGVGFLLLLCGLTLMFLIPFLV